ncbi:MAG: LON peptidase substrate-binding domain-containing protein, partial [Bacteroidaceae bacterium]|nr:LON peptidase substrate-binding domain-containing protein [Bacteroidaceae bacterium]
MFSSNKSNNVSFVAQIDNNVEELINKDIQGNSIPLLALRDNVLAPGNVIPVNIGRSISRNIVKDAEKNGTLLVVATQKSSSTEIPQQNELYEIATIASVVHLMKVSDGNYNILLQGFNRVRIKRVRVVGEVGKMHLEADVVNSPVTPVVKENELEYETIVDMICQHFHQLTDIIDVLPDEMAQFIDRIKFRPFLVNFILQNLPIDIMSKMDILEMDSEEERAINLLRRLKALLNLANLKRNIEHKTRMDLDKQQRDYYISQEIRNLQSELGNGDENTNKMDDIAKMRLAAYDKEWSKEMANTFEKELNRLNRINAQSPDYNIQLNYVQTILQLPWDHCTKDRLNMKTAERVLNRDHYGMEKVKERILEHLAVLKLRGDQKSPIICLYGPPGVGKTSLGKSIASNPIGLIVTAITALGTELYFLAKNMRDYNNEIDKNNLTLYSARQKLLDYEDRVKANNAAIEEYGKKANKTKEEQDALSKAQADNASVVSSLRKEYPELADGLSQQANGY